VHTIGDFGLIFEKVPLMCDNTSAISIAKNLLFHKRMRHFERKYHFLRDHVEKGDIEMRYIDTEKQLLTSLLNPLILLALLFCGRKLIFVILMACFHGELDLYLVYLYLLHFLHNHLSHFASLVILTCIWLIMLITVLG
jgi:hypothetical protein